MKILYAFFILVILLLGIRMLRYFLAMTDDAYRSKVKRCGNCLRFEKTDSPFEGHCTVWDREVLKNSWCEHYYPKNEFIRLLEQVGI